MSENGRYNPGVMNQDIKRYHEAVAYLEGLRTLPVKADKKLRKVENSLEIQLKRMESFLSLIGNPHKGLNYVHVTGTSGKGSVATLIKSMLESAGYKTGIHASPFITTTVERIQINDQYISPREFADLVDYLKPFIDQFYIKSPYGRPSYHQIIIAMCFLYFKKHKVDWCVMEVLSGGRFDPTNVIDAKISVITNIDLDHTHILGKTLKEIAYAKAGIIKKGAYFFTTEKRPALLKILEAECKEKKAVYHHISKKEKHYKKLNMDLAASVAKHIGLTEKQIDKGIKEVKLPSRFETVQDRPHIILDGAHNTAKIKSTKNNLEKLKFNKLHLVFALSAGKDNKNILKEIVPLADTIHFTTNGSTERKSAQPKDLWELAKTMKKPKAVMSVHLDPEDALKEAERKAHKDDLVLITGSFHLAGKLRQHWYPEEWILRNRKMFRR